MNELTINQPRDDHPTQRRGYLVEQLQQQQAQNSQAEQFGLQDLIRIFGRHLTLIISIVAIVTLATFAWQMLSPNLFKAKASIQVELIDDTGTNQADISARNSQRITNESKLYRSRNSARSVVEALGLHKDAAFFKEMGGAPSGDEAAQIDKAVSTLLAMTSVESESGSDLIELTATARSPELAAEIANAFPAAVRDLKRKRSEERRQELLDDLTAERSERVTLAKEAADALAEFRVQNRMLVGAGGAEDLAQLNRIAAEAASAAARGAGASAASAGVGSAAAIRSTAGATNAAVQQLQRQEAQLNAELASLTQTYGDGYPEVARVRAELQTVQSNLATEKDAAKAAAQAQADAESARMAQLARADAARDQARAGRLRSTVSALTSKAYQNAANTPLLEQLESEAVSTAQAVSEIADRITRVRSEKLVEGVSSNIISPAIPSNQVVSPSPMKTTVIALIGSLIIGMLIAFIIDMLDDRLRTVAQMRKYFGMPVFGMLPLLDEGISSKLRESPLFKEPQSMFSEVARSMYSEVRALMPINQSQSVLVTSPLPGDGKSVVALTLAAAAVSMGKRAVILDLDLRRSGILQMIQQDINAPDLMDVVRGEVNLPALNAPDDLNAVDTKTGVDLITDTQDDEMLSRFALLSASAPVAEPAAVLSSSKFHQMVQDLKSRFDLVVVNAPAVLAVRDARAMCDYTDHTVLVARWGDTTIDQFRATLEMLGSGNVAGCVYNQVDYAEHARRRYGDSVQFYYEAADYYVGVPRKLTLKDRILRKLRSRRTSSAAS